MQTQARFTAAENGFRFPNQFLTKARWSGIRAPIVGLCGGMCYAALDGFYDDIPMQPTTDPPQAGTPLYGYLYNRQMDSLKARKGRLPAFMRITQWMMLSNSELVRRTLTEEAPLLRHSISRGEPAVLALIRARSIWNWAQNHQVLALGYSIDALGAITISLYDPNHPGFEPTLSLDLHDRWISQSTGERLRGFFVMPYEVRHGNG